MMEDFARHYQIRFREPELLRLALTHRSYLSVTGKGPGASNERLEFLGDSVLGLVTSEFLYRAHPGEHEGQLTKTKSLLVSKAILSRRALAMGLGRFVFMSHSEVESGGRQRLSILADAFESVVAAIYLDQGFEPARQFIHDWLLHDAREIAADKRHTNYKSHLQEYVQSTFRTHPVYRIRSEVGPDHSKQFMVDVMVGRRAMGSGKGRNKKEAEQAAARDALEKAHHKIVEDAPRDAAPVARVAERTPQREGVRDDERPRRREVAGDDDRSRRREVAGDDDRSRRREGRRGGRGRGPEPVAEAHGDEMAAHRTPGPERAPVRAADEERPRPRRERGERAARPEVREAPVETRGERRPRRPFERLEAIAPSPSAAGPRAPARAAPAEHAPAPAAPWTSSPHDDEDWDEIGRPEGPHEERRVDPFSLEDESTIATERVLTTGPTGLGGRSVVGPMHRMGPTSDTESVEPQEHETSGADRFVLEDPEQQEIETGPKSATRSGDMFDPQETESRERSAEPRTVERAEPTVERPTYGRRPGRSRR